MSRSIEMCPKVFWNASSSFHTFSLAERLSTFNEFTEETKINWETFLAVFPSLYFLTEELSDAVLMCLCPVCGLSRSVTVLLWFSSWLTSNSQSEARIVGHWPIRSQDCGALTNQRRGLWGTDQSEAGTVGHWPIRGRDSDSDGYWLIMCEADTVQYLRDLIQEKDYLEKIEGHSVIKTLLDQGELTVNDLMRDE